MLSNYHFYHRLTRKYVVVFGNMFNNITLLKANRDTNEEIERTKVPIIFGPKEKYITRTQSDPDLNREIQINLPMMSYDITTVSYDPSRKQNSMLRVSGSDTTSRVASQWQGVPYDLGFTLEIYARHIDDADQIVEQIFPYFTPDYSVTMESVPEVGFKRDIPIILNNVNRKIEYEGNFDSVRYVNWSLDFNMKAWYYGPVSTPKIIRTVFANIYNDLSLQAGYIVRVNTVEGNGGIWKLDDMVYQGDTQENATAFGTVIAWNPLNGKLVIGGAQGQFKLDHIIRSVSTNAAYKIDSFDASPLKLVEIKIVPDPIDAEPDDDYGYTTTIKEFPEVS